MSAVTSMILGNLADGRLHSITEVVEDVVFKDPTIYQYQVRATILGLIRRNLVELSDDFKISWPIRTP
jgi:hypothetical protein